MTASWPGHWYTQAGTHTLLSEGQLAGLTLLENQEIKPNLLRKEAMPIRAANHVSVSHACPLPAHQVSCECAMIWQTSCAADMLAFRPTRKHCLISCMQTIQVLAGHSEHSTPAPPAAQAAAHHWSTHRLQISGAKSG